MKKVGLQKLIAENILFIRFCVTGFVQENDRVKTESYNSLRSVHTIAQVVDDLVDRI